MVIETNKIKKNWIEMDTVRFGYNHFVSIVLILICIYVGFGEQFLYWQVCAYSPYDCHIVALSVSIHFSDMQFINNYSWDQMLVV